VLQPLASIPVETEHQMKRASIACQRQRNGLLPLWSTPAGANYHRLWRPFQPGIEPVHAFQQSLRGYNGLDEHRVTAVSRVELGVLGYEPSDRCNDDVFAPSASSKAARVSLGDHCILFETRNIEPASVRCASATWPRKLVNIAATPW
jgi:hypothetical protein